MSRVAQKWADHLIRTEQVDHSGGPYGENVWRQSGGSFKASRVVDSWYNEVKSYNYERGQFSPQTAHFTQLVWVASRKLGLGVSRKNGQVVVVANYDPPGNFVDRAAFQKNVLRPRN